MTYKKSINEHNTNNNNISNFSNEESFINVYRYALEKGNNPLYKTFLLGTTAGIFIGFGYIASLMGTRGNWNNLPIGIKNFIFAVIFTVAIVMIIFIGGEMFTSNSLAFITVIKKQLTIKKFVTNLLTVLLGNTLGCFIMATLTMSAGFLKNKEFYENITQLINNKLENKWFENLASGILCNFLVAGAVYGAHTTRSAIAKYFIVSIIIIAFAISGFSHVVANSYLWFIQLFLKIYNPEWKWRCFIIFGCIIQLPTLVGNFLSGGIFLPFLYYITFKNDIFAKKSKSINNDY